MEYASSIGRGGDDTATLKPQEQSWYNVKLGSGDYHAFLEILRNRTYVYNSQAFKRLEDLKREIEEHCGFQMDWYPSRETSKAKRILYSKETDVYDLNKYQEHFDWPITHYDRLKAALAEVDMASKLS